ncbi:winged helix-turn-helix domain-containing tetratricopeptide repeat protein [Paralimibaculum aggregatum]|uniref:Winged helix-turn-helix domain-containing tetratricopeptide repeat protein n=1 Tax=Paralimibaculum aggregatum TaxID=3036245 RepID=A0ABQ6LT01_9RHOB|nr:winged helix-turn-helix domain-containing tetratricopeptide repeat protein [Limibaculum sp. NKW23]
MLRHARRGQVGAAAEAFEALRQQLEDDLDALPSGGTGDLQARILSRQIAPDPVAGRGRGAPPPGSWRRLRLAGAVAIALAGLAGAVTWWQGPERPVSAPRRALPSRPPIAMLPLDGLGYGKDRGFLGGAIAEAIITEPSRLSGLFVVARNSGFHYRDTRADLRAIAGDPGVRCVPEGSRQKAGDRLRATVRLIDARAGNHLWARSDGGDMSDIFQFRDRIAASVAATLGETLHRIDGEAAMKADPAGLEAFEHALAAVRSFRAPTREGSCRARLEYAAALAADPDMAFAHSGLAWVHINGIRRGRTDLGRAEAPARARDAAETALRLAPPSEHAHFALANVLMHAGERGRAMAAFGKTLALNPDASHVMAPHAERRGHLGRFEEAADRLLNAMRLAPHHPDRFHWNPGRTLYSSGRCGEALAALHRMPSPPGSANRTLAAISVCLGRMEEARAAIRSLREQDPASSAAKFGSNFDGRCAGPADLEARIADLRTAGPPD